MQLAKLSSGMKMKQTADAPNLLLWWMKIEEASDKPDDSDGSRPWIPI
jgi:hypothetical protein